jgi:hypothetical protein
MTAEFAIAAGSRIAHYRVEGRIGAGGMGEVYKAIDLTLERPVAMKILPPQLLNDSDRVRRFVQEAKSASALNHPHIVTIYEIGQAPVEVPGVEGAPALTVHYLAMELIEGRTLRSMIYGDTPLNDLLKVLAQTADGLAKAHGAGIVHRDLKPDNIMVTNDGYAKIVDFGLAKLTEQARKEQGRDASAMTQAGLVVGTVGYMSPEQVEGAMITPASDIFSFGCILYECAVRKRPFDGDLAIDTLHKIMFSEPLPVTMVRPDVPGKLQPIIDLCLRKKAGERYASIREVAVALRQVDSSAGMQVVPMTPQNGATVMLQTPSAGGFAAPSAGGTPAAAAHSGTRPPVAAAAPARKRRRRWNLASITSAAYKLVLLAVIAIGGYTFATWPNLGKLAENDPAVASWTDLDDVSSSLRRGVIAAQDPEFYKRRAIDLQKLPETAKAIASPERGRFVPSPLTRQLAHQLYPAPWWNPLRVPRDWIIAAAMEKKLSRNRILELYVNLAPFGEASGIAQASQRYFKKTPGRLSESEAALLSASTTSTKFDPSNPSPAMDALKSSILSAMPAPSPDESEDKPKPVAKPPRRGKRKAST